MGAPEDAPERVLGDKRFQLGDELRTAARVHRTQSAPPQARRSSSRRSRARQTAKTRTLQVAPLAKGTAPVQSTLRLQALEAREIELVRAQLQRVARRLGLQALLPKQLPKLRDVHLQPFSAFSGGSSSQSASISRPEETTSFARKRASPARPCFAPPGSSACPAESTSSGSRPELHSSPSGVASRPR